MKIPYPQLPANQNHPASDVPTVLVADDDDRVRSLVARLLGTHGFSVIEAEHGQAALHQASIVRPHLAMIDLCMPRVDGFRVVRELKHSYGPTLPVLALSGSHEPEMRLRAFDAGADDFVAKPFHVPELLRRVNAFERARQAYLEVERAREQAEQLRLYATEAAALLGHDLNNGLFTALANIGYVQEMGGLTGEPAEALGGAMRALRRAAGLVRNFVDVARIEETGMKPQYQEASIRELVSGALSIHGPEARQRGARVTMSCDDELVAEIDPALMERAIHNILGNAVRYVNPGGTISVSACADERTGELVLDIGNSGPPIPRDRHDAVFAKYVTGADRRSQTGMGLYFCRLVCEAHQGAIALDGERADGVTFRMRVPLRPRRELARLEPSVRMGRVVVKPPTAAVRRGA